MRRFLLILIVVILLISIAEAAKKNKKETSSEDEGEKTSKKNKKDKNKNKDKNKDKDKKEKKCKGKKKKQGKCGTEEVAGVMGSTMTLSKKDKKACSKKEKSLATCVADGTYILNLEEYSFRDELIAELHQSEEYQSLMEKDMEKISDSIIKEYLDSDEFENHAQTVIEEYNKTTEAQDIIRVSIEEAVKIVVDSLNEKLRKEEERVADARNYIFESMEKFLLEMHRVSNARRGLYNAERYDMNAYFDFHEHLYATTPELPRNTYTKWDGHWKDWGDALVLENGHRTQERYYNGHVTPNPNNYEGFIIDVNTAYMNVGEPPGPMVLWDNQKAKNFNEDTWIKTEHQNVFYAGMNEDPDIYKNWNYDVARDDDLIGIQDSPMHLRNRDPFPAQDEMIYDNPMGDRFRHQDPFPTQDEMTYNSPMGDNLRNRDPFPAQDEMTYNSPMGDRFRHQDPFPAQDEMTYNSPQVDRRRGKGKEPKIAVPVIAPGPPAYPEMVGPPATMDTILPPQYLNAPEPTVPTKGSNSLPFKKDKFSKLLIMNKGEEGELEEEGDILRKVIKETKGDTEDGSIKNEQNRNGAQLLMKNSVKAKDPDPVPEPEYVAPKPGLFPPKGFIPNRPFKRKKKEDMTTLWFTTATTPPSNEPRKNKKKKNSSYEQKKNNNKPGLNPKNNKNKPVVKKNNPKKPAVKNDKPGFKINNKLVQNNKSPKEPAQSNKNPNKRAQNNDNPNKSAQNNDNPNKSAQNNDNPNKSAQNNDNPNKSAQNNDNPNKSAQNNDNPNKSAQNNNSPNKEEENNSQKSWIPELHQGPKEPAQNNVNPNKSA